MASLQQWRERHLHKYEGMMMLNKVRPHILDRVKTFSFAESDILISTYPRSGTTWTMEITWLICNNVDFVKAKSVNLDHRCYFLEYYEAHLEKSGVEYLEETPPPRVIKTHLKPYMFANQLGKVPFKTIVTMRNLKDVLVSSFLMFKKIFNLGVSWSEYFEMFKMGELPYGSWVDHCLAWWRLRDQSNILILKYEELRSNPEEAIRKIAHFCGKELSSEQVTAVCEYTNIARMRNSSSITPDGTHESRKEFFRKGIVGDWKEYFTKEQKEYVDELLRNTTEKEGLYFEDTSP